MEKTYISFIVDDLTTLAHDPNRLVQAKEKAKVLLKRYNKANEATSSSSSSGAEEPPHQFIFVNEAENMQLQHITVENHSISVMRLPRKEKVCDDSEQYKTKVTEMFNNIQSDTNIEDQPSVLLSIKSHNYFH